MVTRAERLREASRTRRAEQRQHLRAAILAAAGELFLSEGYAGFSVRRVAERIGYTPTTIYLYFRDKDDLLFAVVDEGFDQFRTAMAAAAETVTDPLERLEVLGRAYIRWGTEHPAYYQLMFMQRTDFLFGNRPNATQPRIAAFQVLQMAVQEALDTGAISHGDVESISTALWSMVHGIVALRIAMPTLGAERMENATTVALAMARRGLRAHGQGTGASSLGNAEANE